VIIIRYLLLGYGISNQSIQKYFDTYNIEYTLYDDYLEDYNKNVDLNSFDIIIKSPIIKNDHWLIVLSRKLNKIIITDLELFYKMTPRKNMITVTGTNGKTTTVSLISKLIDNIDLAGNIGIPLFDFIESIDDIVIEASSFMLEYTEKFHSKYNVILNLTPNHLDHHQNFKNYVLSKFKLLNNIKKNDYLIYNYDDLLLRRLVQNLDVNLIPFSIEEEVDGGYLKNNDIYYKKKKILNIENINLLGRHNLANIAASICAVINYDPKIKNIEKNIQNFQPVEHRIEHLGLFNNLNIYNDSKSTNYRALKTALDSFKGESILLICGGRKQADNINVLDNSLNNIKLVLTNGENKDIFNCYFTINHIPFISFDTLDQLLSELDLHLKNISIVLFSPGAPSYDQFKNYAKRGEFFKNKILKD